MPLNDPDEAWDVWVLWDATGRRFLPSQLLAENEALLNDIITLDAMDALVQEDMKRG